jgi:hypothetical protein
VSRRLRTFLYSWRNIAGCALALGGLALHFTGLIAGLEWLPITAGLYLIAVLLVPGERSLDLKLDGTANLDDIRKAIDQLLNSIKGRVPADIYARVASIRGSMLVTLGSAVNGSGGGASASMVADPNVYLIRQTALSYLPEALSAYMALPGLYRDRSVGGRKSAHDTLLDQLNLMDEKMREVAEAIVAHDTDRLEAHGRFLAEKFGGSTLDLDEAVAQAATQDQRAATAPPAPAEEQASSRDRARG